MKRSIFWIIFFSIFAFSDSSYWTDGNNCSYCLNGRLDGGKCVPERKYDSYYSNTPTFSIGKVSKNSFWFYCEHKLSLQVFCKNKGDYCKTINDSMVKKFEPSLNGRKSFCKEQSKSSVNTGMVYSYTVGQDNVEFLCDFVDVNFNKSYFKVFDEGFCTVQVKRKRKMPYETTRHFYGLYITKGKAFEITNEEFLVQTRKAENPLFDDAKTPLKKDFFSVGFCHDSNCEILNYIEKQARNFEVKCDFIKKIDGSVDKVKVLAEGVCPIEVQDKNNEKKVHYVRSVKNGNGYKLLMTNKQK